MFCSYSFSLQQNSTSTVCMDISKKRKNIFEPYLSTKLVEEGLSNKTLIQGKLRINPRNYEDAFVSDPVSTIHLFSQFLLVSCVTRIELALRTEAATTTSVAWSNAIVQ